MYINFPCIDFYYILPDAHLVRAEFGVTLPYGEWR
jgi:hypothetical protein